MSVALTASEAFRFMFDAAPDRHLRAALIDLKRDIDLPNGVRAVGYRESDILDLVAGTLKQQRLLATSPKPVTDDDLAEIFTRSKELR